jgi:UDP-N-acetylmuramoyl-L-alanyl-D-glutamate--2,6-diaminopimelate ligase
MTLGELIGTASQAAPGQPVRVLAESAALGRVIKGVVYDSRKAGQGSLFVALRGQHVDGTQFVPQALARGAVAVVSEAEPPPDLKASWIVVPDARRALAALAAAFYAHPSREMTVVGITGTNGKTTTAYLIGAVFETAGIRCGILGTVVYRIGDREREAGRTTPEAPDVQQLLREMAGAGCGACAMEVSSHALALHRVDGTRFAAAVFTNLTRDHLDFHGDMETYFRAKRRLFELLPEDGVAVINADDARGAALAGIGRRTVTYAIDRAADVKASEVSFSLDGTALSVDTPAGRVHVRSRLVGRPNVYNALATVATAVGLGIAPEIIERALASVAGVPGRFQVVSESGDDITVVVDYAHTDDALKNLLETARPLATRQLITVFGCGGDRDRTKRPLMGAVAARLSDVVVVTSDNPRSEDPAEIIEEVKRGIVPPADRARPAELARNGHRTGPARAPQLMAIVDRRAAIERAVDAAGTGDMVLIAGKGHEKYQAIGDKVLPFDDVEVAHAALARRRGGEARGPAA